MPNRLGLPVPVHLTGAGWAVLSVLPDGELANVVPRSAAVPPHMRDEINRGRELGYVVYYSVRMGIRAIAAPIVSNGQAIGAISVAHLRGGRDKERIAATGEHVLTAARHTEQQLESLPLPRYTDGRTEVEQAKVWIRHRGRRGRSVTVETVSYESTVLGRSLGFVHARYRSPCQRVILDALAGSRDDLVPDFGVSHGVQGA
jgi:Bacterial transcriptional regulator